MSSAKATARTPLWCRPRAVAWRAPLAVAALSASGGPPPRRRIDSITRLIASSITTTSEAVTAAAAYISHRLRLMETGAYRTASTVIIVGSENACIRYSENGRKRARWRSAAAHRVPLLFHQFLAVEAAGRTHQDHEHRKYPQREMPAKRRMFGGVDFLLLALGVLLPFPPRGLGGLS